RQDNEWLWHDADAPDYSRGRFCPRFALTFAPLNKRAQGKPDASRIRWPCVQGRAERHTSIAVTTGGPSIRLSLHDERYGLFRALPGALSPVIASNALRLAHRSVGFTFVQLKHQPRVPGPHGFAVRLMLRPSITPVTIAITDIDGVRPTITP